MTNNTDEMVSDALRGSWVHRFLPKAIWPYAQLARWERPIGWQLLMWPCLWSVMLAAEYKGSIQTIVGTQPMGIDEYLNILLPTLLLFIAGAFVMRGAGCTFNDIVDQNIDNKVARTRSRPLPSGRVSKRNAWIFLGLQLLAGLVILVQFNVTTQIMGVASIVLIVIYPFMKRITWWPQFFLGLAFSWGALMGWSAIIFEYYPFEYYHLTFSFMIPAIILYLGCICWVIGYDTIYAHQDIEDDAIVGVKSTARLFNKKTKQALIVLYSIAIILFGLAFYFANASRPAWFGLAIVAMHLAWQVKTFEYENPEKCLMLFKSNNWLGILLFIGMLFSILL
ncbi:MAG: 4-hydroxybenzoate octaprenyltransferase [Hyphomicrobiales bacterium]|nr:4-hydroxybenzoate octaprenyltransferase [Hyphomicrobiales bacterium]PCH50212.1 MAG: 4-hydroxybenzoate octaprenyltransferase [Hyphomicrobiales bacterium]